jgi:hypothetical protein
VGDDVSFERAVVVELELLDCLAGRKLAAPTRISPQSDWSAADLAFQPGGEELLMRPALGPGSVS